MDERNGWATWTPLGICWYTFGGHSWDESAISCGKNTFWGIVLSMVLSNSFSVSVYVWVITFLTHALAKIGLEVMSESKKKKTNTHDVILQPCCAQNSKPRFRVPNPSLYTTTTQCSTSSENTWAAPTAQQCYASILHQVRWHFAWQSTHARRQVLDFVASVVFGLVGYFSRRSDGNFTEFFRKYYFKIMIFFLILKRKFFYRFFYQYFHKILY